MYGGHKLYFPFINIHASVVSNGQQKRRRELVTFHLSAHGVMESVVCMFCVVFVKSANSNRS